MRDRKLPGDMRREYADATGKPRGERLSEFFDFERWPEKKAKPVNRLELLAILTRAEEIRQQSKWSWRLWQFLKRPVGSKPVVLGEVKATDAEQTA